MSMSNLSARTYLSLDSKTHADLLEMGQVLEMRGEVRSARKGSTIPITALVQVTNLLAVSRDEDPSEVLAEVLADMLREIYQREARSDHKGGAFTTSRSLGQKLGGLRHHEEEATAIQDRAFTVIRALGRDPDQLMRRITKKRGGRR